MDINFQFNNAEVLIRNVEIPQREIRNVTPTENIMRLGTRIMTPMGIGTIKSREADTGILADRFCVTLDDISQLDGIALETHNQYGGVYFLKSELKEVSQGGCFLIDL